MTNMVMKKLRAEVVVDAPADDVFEFFRTMDEARYLAWHPEHISFRYVDGDRIDTGTRAYFEEEIGDEYVESTVRYTEVRRPAYIEFRDESRFTRFFNPKNTFRFEPVDGGTRVVAAIYLRIGPLERLSSTVRHEVNEVRRHMREEGENLQLLIEADEATPEAT